MARSRSEAVERGSPGRASDLVLLLAFGLRAAPVDPAVLQDDRPDGGPEDEQASSHRGAPTKLYFAYGLDGTIPPDPAPDVPVQGAGMSEHECPDGAHWEEGQCVLDQPDDMTPPDPAPDDGA